MLINILISNNTISEKIIICVAIIITALISIVLHEIGHGLVALWNGDRTAKDNNRLTLNPVAHLDWIGAVSLLVFGFGWAKPVPINPNEFKNRKVGIITVSIAGRSMNLILAALNLLLLWIFYPLLLGLVISTSAVRLLGLLFIYVFEYMVLYNVILAFFNLLPIFPLDGFNLINAFLPYGNKFSSFMFRYGWICLLGLILVSNVLNYVGLSQFNVFHQVQNLAMALINKVIGV